MQEPRHRVIIRSDIFTQRLFYNLLSFIQIRWLGLVVVRDSKVVGLHCSGPELHAGQAAIIQHGANLANCQLFFSRRPCATCLKMIINGETGGEG